MSTFTARKLTSSPFVEFYRRDGNEAPKRLPITPRLQSAPTNIRFSDKGEKVAITVNDTFPGNTLTDMTALGSVFWARSEKFVILGGNASNRARLYERYGKDAMLRQVNDDLLPVSPDFIAMAAFGGSNDEWLFVRFNSDATTKVRVFRYGYTGFVPVQEITLGHAWSRVHISASTIVFDNGGTSKTIYRIEMGTALVPKSLPVGFPASAVILTVNPTGKTILYYYNATTVISGVSLADRYVTTLSYDPETGDLVDDGITANRIGLNENFNNRNVIPGAGHAKANLQIEVSGDGKLFVLYARHLQAPTATNRSIYSFYNAIVSVHEWAGETNAAARHYNVKYGPYATTGTGTLVSTGPDPKISADNLTITYFNTQIVDGAVSNVHDIVELYRGAPNAAFSQRYLYQRTSDPAVRMSVLENWPALGHTSGGLIQARQYTADAYGRRRALDFAGSIGAIPVNRLFSSVTGTGQWPWAADLTVDQASNIVYSPTARYVLFKRNTVAPTTFEFRRYDAGVWNFAESYSATSVQIFHTDDPTRLTFEGAYALPLNSVIEDIVFSFLALAVAFHASHPTIPEVYGRYVLNLDGEGDPVLAGKEAHGSRSRLSFSPKLPMTYFAATWDMAPAESRVDLYKFATDLNTFTNPDNEPSKYGPIAFSACDDVIVVHGGDTGLPFTLFNRDGDTLELREVSGFEDFPAEVLDIKYLPDCSGLVILVPGKDGEPPKVVVIETIDDEETGEVIGLPPIEMPLPDDEDAPPTGVDVGYAEDGDGNTIIDENGQPVISIVVQRENQDIVSPNTRPNSEGIPPLPNQSTTNPYDPWNGTDPNTGLPVPPPTGQPNDGKKGLVFLDLKGKPVRDEGPPIPRELIDRTYPIAVSVNVGFEH